MPGDIKLKYPSTSTTSITISLASLVDDNTNKIAGQESTAIDNTTNTDMDHLVSGYITTGTSPTANRTIEVWAYAVLAMASGTPTYPDVLDGTDSAETFTSRNVLLNVLRPVATLVVDSTSNRAYPFGPVSISQLYGELPQFWGLFVINCTGVALNSTSGNHVLQYNRIQAQYT